ncbi:UNVERIFIED_CONTAM: Galactinol synthase 1 [Sesamum angustifolium]|uniref:Hexosyltransferase n=1 Tax=Sesamum angustifolium TaxID=2727405 RepID=A0AAW2QW10_9LAMI
MAPQLVSAGIKAVDFAKPAVLPNRAYVTFLAGNRDYVKGVVGLAKGWRKVKSAYPLLVAVLPDVPPAHRRLLLDQGCIVREIDPIYPPDNQTQFAMAYYVINYSKLRIWAFVEYNKMVYLDGDIQVYDNIDHLFDLEDGYFYAVMDCFCEKTWSHTPTIQTWLLPAMPGKGFFNMFFKDIYQPIPNVYNLVLAMLWRHPENVELDQVKVVHYCAAGSKPWRYTAKEDNMQREDIKMLVKKWWDVYNDDTLDYKKPVVHNDGALESGALQPLIAAAMTEANAPAVKYVAAPSAA